MKRKYSLILLILILAILICCIFTSCKNKNSIDYSVAVLGHNPGSHDDWNLKQIVSSVKQLETINSKYDLSKYTTFYDDLYFEDKSLIIILFVHSHLGASISVNSLEKIDTTLYINMVNKEKKYAQYAAAEDYWICILEVNNEDIKEVDVVELNSETKKIIF